MFQSMIRSILFLLCEVNTYNLTNSALIWLFSWNYQW